MKSFVSKRGKSQQEMKAKKILCTFAVIFLLVGCQTTTRVAFQNAKLDRYSQTEEVSGWLTKPEGGGPFPAVVLLHTCGGLQPHVTVDWATYLKELGYVTLAVDSFGSRGLGPCPNSLLSDKPRIMMDAYGGFDYLKSLPYVDKHKIAVMGFSLGANIINSEIIPWSKRTLRDNDFKAGISLYGFCYGITSDTPFPIMVVVGDKDKYVAPSCQLLDLEGDMVEIHIFPGIYHGFDVSQITTIKEDHFGNPMLYDWQATKKARELVKSFLAKHLGME